MPVTSLFRGLARNATRLRQGRERPRSSARGPGPGTPTSCWQPARPVQAVEPLLVSLTEAAEVFPLFQHRGIEISTCWRVSWSTATERRTPDGAGGHAAVRGGHPHGPTGWPAADPFPVVTVFSGEGRLIGGRACGPRRRPGRLRRASSRPHPERGGCGEHRQAGGPDDPLAHPWQAIRRSPRRRAEPSTIASRTSGTPRRRCSPPPRSRSGGHRPVAVTPLVRSWRGRRRSGPWLSAPARVRRGRDLELVDVRSGPRWPVAGQCDGELAATSRVRLSSARRIRLEHDATVASWRRWQPG